MKVFFTLLLTIIGLSEVVAQRFTFSEVHPTHQRDSLERWLNTHKAPTIERLKNLIVIEQTYTWSNINRLLLHLEEIKKLSDQYDNEVGKGAYFYFKAFYFHRHKQAYTAFNELQKAISIFEKQRDQGALLCCYGLALKLQYGFFGTDGKTKVDMLKKQYVENVERYYKSLPTLHNYLEYQSIQLVRTYGEGSTDVGQKLNKIANETLQTIGKHPELSYGYFRMYIYLAISHFRENRLLESYNINKRAEALLKPDQAHERGVIYYNLATDCLRLNKLDEGAEYCQKGLGIVDTYEPNHYVSQRALYELLRNFQMSKRDYKQVVSTDDSVLKYERLSTQKSNDIKMLELEAQFEFEQKQKEIKELQQKQQQTTLLLIIATVVITIIVFLGYKLYRANQLLNANKTVRERLFGIIAHDLRRPMHAFHQMGELINFHLKRKEYDRIERFSHALDESGLAIQKLLDNLLGWVLSQQYSIPYNPTPISLHEPVTTVVDLYRKVSVLKNITFEVDCPASLVVYADGHALELIIRNLIDNAHKASPTNGKIIINAKQVSSTTVSLSITDNGSGLSASMLGKIRQIFLMPDVAVVGVDGIGMGLPTVSRFVKRNQGRIWVENSPNNGTVFSVEMPSHSSKGV